MFPYKETYTIKKKTRKERGGKAFKNEKEKINSTNGECMGFKVGQNCP